MDLLNAGYGLLGGLASGVVQWKKRYPDTDFDFWKMAPTLVVSAAAGFAVGLSGVVPTDAAIGQMVVAFSAAGADVIVGNLLKMLKRKVLD